MGADPPGRDDLAARALEQPRREEIVTLLREAPAGLDVSEIAAALSLHPNTVRWHLGQLADAGLVASRTIHRGRPGRPRILYEATSGARRDADGYRFLAEMLASAVAATSDGEQVAERAGRAWGGHLVEGPPPLGRLPRAEALTHIVDLLADHGFAPRLVEDSIEMHRCPFHDLVDRYGGVVCGLHRGLLAGALEELGSGITLDVLEPYAEPGVCRARLLQARAS